MRLLKHRKKTKLSNISSYYSLLSDNSICIDCGANIGNITLEMAKTGAVVYAFEPNKFAYQKLKENTQEFTNIIYYNKGVYTQNTNRDLFFHENSGEDEVYWSTGSSLLNFKSNVDINKKETIELIDLDQFIIDLNKKVTLLKMDVEGVEIEIINKLIDTGTIKYIEHFLVETHEEKIPELKKPTDDLRLRLKKEKINNVNLNWV